MGLWLSGEKDADRLLTERPLALLIGMVLDQQVPFERAFSAPLELQRRLGKPLTAKAIAATDPDELRELFSRTKALHRFPGAMADRVHALCTILIDEWGGKAESVWTTAADADELLARLKKLPGFGEQKAKIFLALLGKQVACRPKGWRSVSSPYGDAGTTMSVADISDEKSLQKVRSFKRAAKAAHRAANA
jgi:uncharacterized HhH-GPD family protein